MNDNKIINTNNNHKLILKSWHENTLNEIRFNKTNKLLRSN